MEERVRNKPRIIEIKMYHTVILFLCCVYTGICKCLKHKRNYSEKSLDNLLINSHVSSTCNI